MPSMARLRDSFDHPAYVATSPSTAVMLRVAYPVRTYPTFRTLEYVLSRSSWVAYCSDG